MCFIEFEKAGQSFSDVAPSLLATAQDEERMILERHEKPSISSGANLLTIPSEILAHIVGYLPLDKVFKNTTLFNSKYLDPPSPLNILCACRRPNIESTDFLYRHSTFRIYMPFSEEKFPPPMTRTAHSIRNLEIIVNVPEASKHKTARQHKKVKQYFAALSPRTIPVRSRETCYVTIEFAFHCPRKQRPLWLPKGIISMIKSLRGFKTVYVEFVPHFRPPWPEESRSRLEDWEIQEYVPFPLEHLLWILEPVLGTPVYSSAWYTDFHQFEFTAPWQ